MPKQLNDLAQQRTTGGPLPPQARAAVIQTDAAADTDELMVTIPLLSKTALRGPCKGWQTRDGALPSIGDSAAVIELDDRSLWVIAWWPAA